MLKLSGQRIQLTNEWLAQNRELEITKDLYYKCNCLLEKILEGHSLTKEEIVPELLKNGLTVDNYRLTRFLMDAEANGIICSGIDKGKKSTYALLEERIAPTPELTKEEALAKLAKHYFRSHSPASLQDFTWWSGLTATEARQAIHSILPELQTDHSTPQELWIHESCYKAQNTNDSLHLLPAFDEYLISYKDRTAVLSPAHTHKAYNNYGTFYPVIFHNNKIVGNWKKNTKKNFPQIETSLFEDSPIIAPEKVETAIQRYISFISG